MTQVVAWSKLPEAPTVLEDLVGNGEHDGVGGSDGELAGTGGQGQEHPGGEEEEKDGGGKEVGPHLFYLIHWKIFKSP